MVLSQPVLLNQLNLDLPRCALRLLLTSKTEISSEPVNTPYVTVVTPPTRISVPVEPAAGTPLQVKSEVWTNVLLARKDLFWMSKEMTVLVVVSNKEPMSQDHWLMPIAKLQLGRKSKL
jgi:hypothetical protein